jgi:hypothetical protein
MKRLIVGGNFGECKKSSVVKKLAKSLYADEFNGGNLSNLNSAKQMVVDYDLIVWMPNISNEIEKDYPKKKKGSILICSKRIDEYNHEQIGNAVSRIFRMNANAVIAVLKEDDIYSFKLIDALGNLWIDTEDISELSKMIETFAEWTKNSIRIESIPSKLENVINTDNYVTINDNGIMNFCDIVKKISEDIETVRGNRYFGNASTRCSYTFPSQKSYDGIFVSGRNTPKSSLTNEDFIKVEMQENKVVYFGDKKPSVDTPIQLELYKKLPNINYIIHGHAFIENVKITENYFPCGDMREVEEILNALPDFNDCCGINLKNHGFIILANNLEDLNDFVNNNKFVYRELGQNIERIYDDFGEIVLNTTDKDCCSLCKYVNSASYKLTDACLHCADDLGNYYYR